MLAEKPEYCKSGIFRENFIFVESVKRRIYHVTNSRQGHDLPKSVNGRVISPFREGFIFTKFRKNKTDAKISEFTVDCRMIQVSRVCAKISKWHDLKWLTR